MANSKKPIPSQTNRDAKFLPFQGVNSLRCHRCEGLMAREFILDLQDETGNNGFWGFRCLQCGEILDPLILQNRYAQEPVLIKGRARRKEIIATSTA